MPRRFNDNAKFDQEHARAIEILKTSDSFILFHFDPEQEKTEVISAVALLDMPHAIRALEAQQYTLAIKALATLIEVQENNAQED